MLERDYDNTHVEFKFKGFVRLCDHVDPCNFGVGREQASRDTVKVFVVIGKNFGLLGGVLPSLISSRNSTV